MQLQDRLRFSAHGASLPLSRAASTAVAALAVLAAGSGCSHHPPESRHLPAWVFDASRPQVVVPTPRQARPRGGIRGRSEASDFVVAALQETGLRFGTDGTVPSLWGYLATSHTRVAPTATRTGDVLFFQTKVPAAASPQATCEAPDHVAIVSTVDPDGRIGFVEARGRQVRRSYVDPEHPRLRRDDSGRVLNSFLRPKRIGDPSDTPTFAGEMLCGAVRPKT